LKNIFPLSFAPKTGIVGLLLNLLIYIVVAAICSVLIWVATFISGIIPVVGAIIAWILGIISSLIGLYVLIGIIFSILDWFNILKY
jgi:hypothetical protein